MRSVPTGRSDDFTTADAPANLSLDDLFQFERQRIQGELDRLLDDMLADLHRAMRRAERASAALTARLNAGDYDGAQACAGEFRAAMAEYGRFMREAYGEVRREIAARPAERAHQAEMFQTNLGIHLARSEQDFAVIVIILVGIVFVFGMLPIL